MKSIEPRIERLEQIIASQEEANARKLEEENKPDLSQLSFSELSECSDLLKKVHAGHPPNVNRLTQREQDRLKELFAKTRGKP